VADITIGWESERGGKVPVSSRTLGWLTGAFLALTETAAILSVPWLHPRTTDVRALAVGWVLFSSAAGGLIAGVMHPGAGAKRSGTWSVAVRCMMVGVYLGVATFVLLYVIAWVLVIIAIALTHSSIGGY
jgi:hypothetical protein